MSNQTIIRIIITIILTAFITLFKAEVVAAVGTPNAPDWFIYLHASLEAALVVSGAALGVLLALDLRQRFENKKPNEVSRSGQSSSEPTQPTPAALQHALYHYGAGILMLIFDRTVVINNPVRVSLLQDISTHRENGAISSLEDAKISTVDNEHQSTILAFELPSELRQQMASPSEHTVTGGC